MKRYLENNLGWIIVLILSFLPLLFWLQSGSFQPRTGSFYALAVDAGQIFGLVGMAMFALNLILAARFHFLEKYFSGLNKVYINHGYLGQAAFVLLLLHPLFLIPKYSGGSAARTAGFFLPSGNWAINWGLFSLLLMIILITLTLYLRPRYDLWKWTHKFLGFAFFLGALHVFYIPSDVSRNPFLRNYLFFLSAIGLAAFFYRSLFGRHLVKKFDYIVEDIKRLNSRVVEIVMAPQGKRLHFNPGQFIFASFFDKNISPEEHPFSLVSSPAAETLKIVVKDLGDYTSRLKNLAVGSKVKVEGPFGFFSYKNSKHKKQIWIAGGIGITPFLSMVHSLTPQLDYKIDFYYCVRRLKEAVYLDELERLTSSLNGVLRVIPFCSDKSGFITARKIAGISKGVTAKDIFICAPPTMLRDLKGQLRSLGVNDESIHSEEFNF